MLEPMNKMVEVARDLFEVIPRERLQKLANKILINPVRRAMKKLDQPDVTESIQESIDDFLNDFTPETMAMVVFASIAQSNQANQLLLYLELLDSLGDMKPMIQKFVDVIEKHALAIGRVVERVVVLSHEIKSDLLSDEN